MLLGDQLIQAGLHWGLAIICRDCLWVCGCVCVFLLYPRQKGQQLPKESFSYGHNRCAREQVQLLKHIQAPSYITSANILLAKVT